MKLSNNIIRMNFDEDGRLFALENDSIKIPFEQDAQTNAFKIQLRSSEGKIIDLLPDSQPAMSVEKSGGAQILVSTWNLSGGWGKITFTGRVELPEDSPVSYWTCEIENHTQHAIWQINYPKISGLGSFHGRENSPDWLAVPFGMGKIIPEPVKKVNYHRNKVEDFSRTEFGNFDVEGGGNIAYSYPGMLTMQYLAFGRPGSGGIYFGAHDGNALYKKFGMYADGKSGKHAALLLKQYPEDRTRYSGNFKSFYPAVAGIYRDDWWGASEIYREWAVKQLWCAKGPVKKRNDIPAWVKEIDLWYWNWMFSELSHPRYILPAIRYFREKLGCEIGFHWYSSTGEHFDTSWRIPEIYPENRDIKNALLKGVRELHGMGVKCIPYVNGRTCDPDTESFKKINGMDWIVRDENGNPADIKASYRPTMCPTAEPYQDWLCRIVTRMVDDCEMDGAYLDVISSNYAVPCFDERHDHPPGGHGHWHYGYRKMLEKIQQEIKQRSPGNFIASESVIECFLDLFDLDLAREISNLKGHVGLEDTLPIPMFHSVYHDYHMTYGTVSDFKNPKTLEKANMEAFRLQEALCLTGGGQLMISGFFAGDENAEKFHEQREYMENLIKAHMAARKWLNLGVWKAPLNIRCDKVSVKYLPDLPPKENIPAVLSGCFELDGQLCAVLVNHTSITRKISFELQLANYGINKACKLEELYPGKNQTGIITDGTISLTMVMNAAETKILVVKPENK